MKNGRVTSKFLDLQVTPKLSTEIQDLIHAGVHSPTIIASHNLHSAYLYHTHELFKAFTDQADHVLIDGFPILIDTNLSVAPHSRFSLHHRTGTMDWLPGLLERFSGRVAVIGSDSISNSAFIARASEANAALKLVGLPGENWDDELANRAVSILQDFNPDLVLVGLGMPLQEEFLLAKREKLPPAVYATVGGAIDQYSGVQKASPRWVGRIGLEWLYRLCTQPRRLSYRYLIEPIRLFGLMLRADQESSRKQLEVTRSQWAHSEKE